MLLRKLNSYGRVAGGIGQLLLFTGQFCVVFGVLLSRLSRNGGSPPFGIQLSDFWQGLLAGFAAVLIGVSIPLNITAIRRWRDRQD